jgi:hypothetical protein
MENTGELVDVRRNNVGASLQTNVGAGLQTNVGASLQTCAYYKTSLFTELNSVRIRIPKALSICYIVF